MNLAHDLKKAPLSVGFYSICGEQGAGKTSLAVGLLRTDYKRWRKYRYNLACSVADEYYAVNGIRLNIDRSLYFSNTKILLDKRRGIYTYEIDLERLGLPNPDYEVQYLPRGSVVFIMEADILAYCHNWQSLSDYLRNLIKYVRHWDLTIIFDMQVGGDLAKALRNLTMGIYYVLNSGIKRFWLFWKRQIWHFVYIRNQLVNLLKDLKELGIDMKLKPVERGKFYVWKNVFGFYVSKSAVPYYLNGIEKVGYVYREHSDGDLSVSGIQAYCTAHPLVNTENKSAAPENVYNPF